MAVTQADIDAALSGQLSPQAAQIPGTVLTEEQKAQVKAAPRPSDTSILPAAGGIVGAISTQLPQTRMAEVSSSNSALHCFVVWVYGWNCWRNNC